jgi:MYXO-CTERM domain-containing protein
VLLNGSSSSDPESAPLTYAWSQTSGPAVTLDGSGGAIASFTAPEVKEPTGLVFQLTVNDGSLGASDPVTVTVGPKGGCGCTSAAAGPEWVALLMGGAAFLARRRRTRG